MAEPMPNEHITASDPHHHATDAPGHAGQAGVFSEADWNIFRAEDFAAGKAIVVLMLGIFLMGVALYAVVAYFVATTPV
ncbi:MAG TPA: hypothetical protein VFE62_10050 [Gemmataceae bacterium]|nr:hypothetical protein [Gemmataceae bacterium]